MVDKGSRFDRMVLVSEKKPKTSNPNKRKNEMKKSLTEADYALLKSRGKVLNGFNTSTDFAVSDSPEPKAKKVKKPVEKNPLVGKVLNTSWGYSMTINDYCKIIEVSATGKTVKCRKIKKIMNHAVFSGDGSGRATAGTEVYGPVFRLKVRLNGYNNEPNFHGSYPFCGADKLAINTKMSDCSTRMGHFSFDNGLESYENHMD